MSSVLPTGVTTRNKSFITFTHDFCPPFVAVLNALVECLILGQVAGFSVAAT